MTVGDRVEIRKLKVLGRHGALEGEQDLAQPFEIDLDLYLDLRAAERRDDLMMTVDYGPVAMTVARIVSSRRFALLEALAGAIADELLVDSRIDRAVVTVRKMQPPIPLEMGSTGVRLVRGRTS